MPNWITNNVNINASDELLAKIKSEIKSERSEFDFDKVAPIPKELEGTTSPVKIITKKEYEAQEERIAKGELTDSEKAWGLSRGITKKMSDKFIEKYGFSDWYGWQINNWGTKWNASEVTISDNLISFNTAWSTPFALLVKLSEKYPEARFEVEYSDEDFGYNVGTYTLVGGVEVEVNVPEGGSFEALEMAMIVQYGDVDAYFECNEEKFTEEDNFEDEYSLSDYMSTIIDIAYEHECYPTEDCEYHKLVLDRFKEKAMADEKYELVAIIQKELDKVEN